jgi:hypothetical protein
MKWIIRSQATNSAFTKVKGYVEGSTTKRFWV